MKDDPRLQIGAVVNSRVTLVTNDQECQRLFGRLYKEGTVEGRVAAVITKIVNKRKLRYLDCTWAVGTRKKRNILRLGSVKNGPYPMPPEGWPARELELTFPYDDALSQGSQERQEDAQHRSDSGQNNTRDVTQRVIGCRVRPTVSNDAHAIVGTNDLQQSNASPQTAAVESNVQKWTIREESEVLNGDVPLKNWRVHNFSGQIICEGHTPPNFEPLDYFLHMFPISHLSSMVGMTNAKLTSKQYPVTTSGEIFKFFGFLILMTRYKFGNRRDLWNVIAKHKYLYAAKFGRFMPYHRFEELRSCIRFSHQPSRQGFSSEEHRWMLFEDFVHAINAHRVENVIPSQLLCVDESISRWYGICGDYLDVGLPHYVAIDRKPENGCELQTIACTKSQIMLGISLVKSAEESDQNNDGYNNGTEILLKLCKPWFRTDRIVCAYSFFASVQSASILYEKGLRFIGVLKTATKKYPMKFLSELEMAIRGHWKSLVTQVTSDEGTRYSLMALCWVDRNRHYYVSSTGSTNAGTAQERLRWRCEDCITAQEMVSVEIPKVAEMYHSCASAVDRHNRKRQDNLGLEKCFVVKEWSLCVNTTLLGICVVDAYNLYKGGRGGRD